MEKEFFDLKTSHGIHFRDKLADNSPVVSGAREALYIKRMVTKERNRNLTSHASKSPSFLPIVLGVLECHYLSMEGSICSSHHAGEYGNISRADSRG